MSYESKYVAPSSLARVLLSRLTAVCRRDGEHPVNRVNSVYLDDRELTAMDEVANGDYLKAKVRVRWYEDAAGRPSAAYLECKRKIGCRRNKDRIALPGLQPMLPLHHPAWQRLPLELRAVGGELPHGLLRPTLHISYRRHRFVEPLTGLRLALDDDIRVARMHPRIAHAAAVTRQAANQIVFEAKGDIRELPPNLQFVTAIGARRSSFSKYGLWLDLVARHRAN